MKHRLLLLITGFMISAFCCRAEIELNLALNSRPAPYLADWVQPVNGQMIITMLNMRPPVDAVKLRTTLQNGNGDVIAISNLAGSPVYTLIEGTNIFSVADALQLQYLQFTGSAQRLLQRTGRLVAGNYQLTVEVYNTSGTLLYAQQTRPFLVTSYQLPVLMLPAPDAELDARVASAVIIFRWTSVAAFGQERPVYRVQVFEVMPGQLPMQAFRGNMPLLDEEVRGGTTQYIWHPQLPMLDSTANRQFIWTVQTLDAAGRPVPTADPNIQGRSEPAVFRIRHRVATAAPDSVGLPHPTLHSTDH